MAEEIRIRIVDKALAKTIAEAVHKRGLTRPDHMESLYHALIDISISVQRLYTDIIPRLVNIQELTDEVLYDTLFEFRGEFRHIDYHIHDAELDALEWDRS